MALSFFREFLDTVMYLMFLSGENLSHAVQAHTNWVKESVLPVIEMLNTAFSDDSVSVPVLFQDFPEPGETFLSFNASSSDNVPESGQPEAGQRKEPKEEKHEGAGALLLEGARLEGARLVLNQEGKQSSFRRKEGLAETANA